MTIQSAKQVRRYCQKHAELAGWKAAASDNNGRAYLTLFDGKTIIVAICLGSNDSLGRGEELAIKSVSQEYPTDHTKVGPVRCWRDLREMMEDEG